MATTIGAKLQLDGEKEFKAALKESNESLKVLGSELKLVSAQYDANDKSLEALTKRQDVLSRTYAEQQDKVKLLQERLTEAAQAFGEADSRTKALQTQLNNANAEMVKTQKELEGVTADLKIAESGENAAGDAAEEAGKQAAESGEKAREGGKGWEALGNICTGVGAAMAAAAAAAGAAIVAAGKALTDFAVEGAAYADSISTMSSVTGVSTEKLQELQYAAELVDTSVETIAGSMTKNLQSMNKAAKGNKDLTAAYEKLGVTVTDADGKLRDDETVFWELIDALGNVEDETERDVLAMQVLGKSAKDLNPLIEAGSDKMAELAKEAHDAGYVLSEDTLDSFSEFDDQLQKLQLGTTAAKNALGTILLPVLSDLAGDGVDLLGQFTSGLLEADGDLSKFADIVKEILPQVLDSVMEYVPELLQLAAVIIETVAQALLDNIDLIIDAAADIFQALLDGIMDNLPQIIAAAVTLITTMADALIANLPTIVQGGVDLVLALVKGLTDALPDLIPATVDAVLTIVDALIDNLDLVVDAAVDLIIALADGLIQALPKLLAKAPEIVIKLVEGIIENAPKLLEAGLELILKIGQGIFENFPKLTEKGKEIIDSVWEGIRQKIEDAKNWGKDLIQNFKDGMSGKWESLKQGVRDIGQGIKNYLGFSEPKEGPLSDFHTYAPDMMDLFIKGIRENTGKLRAQLAESFDIQDQLTLPASDFRGAVNGGSSMPGASFPAVNVTIPVTMNDQALGTAMAQIFWVQGQAYVRNLGAAM